ncbi:MAG: hypothetical protein QNJ44_11710 [Rhodobacter sp.]|nr:hypothetical protein [Rhodobacter sp.]
MAAALTETLLAFEMCDDVEAEGIVLKKHRQTRPFLAMLVNWPRRQTPAVNRKLRRSYGN